MHPRGGGRGRGRGGGRGRGRGRGRGAEAAPAVPAVKCFVCGQVGFKPSLCPKGDPAAQKEHADRKTERNNPDLSPEVFPKFLGTVVYDLPHADEPSAERACIVVAPVLPPYLRPGLAKHGDKVIHIYQVQCRILPDHSDKGAVVDTGAQRGAAKHLSEIVAQTGNNHKMIGSLGQAKTLPGATLATP
jgi:hypothetical protein